MHCNFSDVIDDPIILAAKKARGLLPQRPLTHLEQEKEEKRFFRNKKKAWLRPGNYVFLTYNIKKGKKLYKSWMPKMGSIYRVSKIDLRQPTKPMFQITTLEGQKLGLYYETELRPFRPKDKLGSFPIERILHQRMGKSSIRQDMI